MGRAVPAVVAGVSGTPVAMLIAISVLASLGLVVVHFGLLLPGRADAERHRSDRAGGHQRDEEQDDGNFQAAKHRRIMTWGNRGGSPSG